MTKKPVLALLVCSLFLSPLVSTFAQSKQSSIAGEWIGGYELKGNYIPIKTQFKLEGNNLSATLDLPLREEAGVALNQVKYQSPSLHFELPRSAGTIIFDGQLSGNAITGNIQFFAVGK